MEMKQQINLLPSMNCSANTLNDHQDKRTRHPNEGLYIAADERKHSLCPVIGPAGSFITAGLKRLSPDTLRQVRSDSLDAELDLFRHEPPSSSSRSRYQDQVPVADIFTLPINHIEGIGK